MYARCSSASQHVIYAVLNAVNPLLSNSTDATERNLHSFVSLNCFINKVRSALANARPRTSHTTKTCLPPFRTMISSAHSWRSFTRDRFLFRLTSNNLGMIYEGIKSSFYLNRMALHMLKSVR